MCVLICVHVCACVCAYVSHVKGVRGLLGFQSKETTGSSTGDRAPWSVTEATASLCGSIHSILAFSPTQSGQNQLSGRLNGFQWQP